MDERSILDRVRELRLLREEQQRRLEAADAEAEAAEKSLNLIDGALQDCDFWLSGTRAQAPTPPAYERAAG